MLFSRNFKGKKYFWFLLDKGHFMIGGSCEKKRMPDVYHVFIESVSFSNDCNRIFEEK